MFNITLAKRGIEVLYQSKNDVAIRTEKLYDTLFYMQTFGWRILNIIQDDYMKNGQRIERNIVIYER